MLYPDPDNNTVWVAGYATGTPQVSKIWQFFVGNESSRSILTLKNTIVSSIIVDRLQNKVWFAYNSTVGYYSTSHRNTTYPLNFTNESPQYLTLDQQDRLWISLAGNFGASEIAMFDEASGLRTYPIRTANATVQGITVAPDNSIWFAEAGSKKLGRLIPSAPSPFTEYSPPASISLSSPIQVAVDASGDVWFTDHGSDQFGVLDPHPQTPTWKVFPIGYCPDNCVYGLPNAIFVDAKNTVWFSEHIAGRVGRYDPSTGVLTEYAVPGSSTPLMWWAMPGPNNLVWFVAWAFGEIGYVNASIPIPFSISGPPTDVAVQRGSSLRIPTRLTSQGVARLSFGLSPVTQDQSVQFPAQIYGSSPSNLTLSNDSQTSGFSISAAWNATLGPRYVSLTASDGQVAVNAHVRVVVVESSAPFVALGFSTIIALGGVTLYLRRPGRPKIQPVKKTRR